MKIIKEKIDKHFSGIYYLDNNKEVHSNEIFKKKIEEKAHTLKKNDPNQRNKNFEDNSTYDPLRYISDAYIKENSRYVMLFIDSPVSKMLLIEHLAVQKSKKKTNEEIIHLFGSQLPFDTKSTEYYIDILSALKTYVTNGDFVIFSNLESIYGILYELFNQRFSVSKENTNFCQINYGDMKDRILIDKKFGCILLKNKSDLFIEKDIEIHLPSPLLNRFEKHILNLDHFIIHNKYLEFFYLKEIKNVLKKCFDNEILNPLIEKIKEGRNKKSKNKFLKIWEQIGNQLIFSFRNGELIKYIFIKWGKNLKKREIIPEDNKLVKKYKFFFIKLIKYFTIRMYIIFDEYLLKNKYELKFREEIEKEFKRTHTLESLENFNKKVAEMKTKRFVILTMSKITIKLKKDYEIISSKELENLGTNHLRNIFEKWKKEKKKQTLFIYFEDKNQFKHFEHFKTQVDFLFNDKKDVKFKIAFLVDQRAGSGEGESIFFSDLEFDKKLKERQNWKLFCIENLLSSYYK